MNDRKIVLILKTVMTVGLCFIAIGVYGHLYSETLHSMGVTGIVISACFVAIGMIMSLPTKMYLTFVLVNRENEMSHESESNHAKNNQ